MNLKKLKTKEKRYSVKLGESLYLRVSPSGCKLFVLRYAHLGRVKDITLGHYPDLTLLQARQLAHLKREELKIKPSLALTSKRRTLQFKASDVNGIYGKYNTVQPPSLVLNYIIKY